MNNQSPSDLLRSSELQVHSVFQTIQGEGPFSGWPALFVRLSGCNLQCPFCDTTYTGLTDTSAVVTEDNLSAWTSQLIERHYEPKHASPNLLVLTGGEPFRQKASAAFIKTLITESTFDFVQIETNGTLWHHELDWALGKSHALHVIVSPKTPRLNSFLAQSMEYVYYKYVIEAGHIDPNDGLPTSVLGMGKRVARPWENAPSFKSEYNERIFVTPMDAQDSVQNEANIEAAVKVCKKYGYRLNLQVHKLVGLP